MSHLSKYWKNYAGAALTVLGLSGCATPPGGGYGSYSTRGPNGYFRGDSRGTLAIGNGATQLNLRLPDPEVAWRQQKAEACRAERAQMNYERQMLQLQQRQKLLEAQRTRNPYAVQQRSIDNQRELLILQARQLQQQQYGPCSNR